MTLDEILADRDSFDAFVAWQPGLEPLAMFALDARAGTGDTVLAERYGPDGAYPVDWTALGLQNPYNFLNHFGLSDEEWGDGMPHQEGLERRAISGMREDAEEVLGKYVEAFEYSMDVSGPRAGTIGLDDVDWAIVQSWNQAILKDLDEGASVAFWQNGNRLIIGEQQSEAWRMAVEATNGYEPSGLNQSGWITMVSRGGFASRGEISVSGNYDAAPFKATLREFSNKEITFA